MWDNNAKIFMEELDKSLLEFYGSVVANDTSYMKAKRTKEYLIFSNNSYGMTKLQRELFKQLGTGTDTGLSQNHIGTRIVMYGILEKASTISGNPESGSIFSLDPDDGKLYRITVTVDSTITAVSECPVYVSIEEGNSANLECINAHTQKGRGTMFQIAYNNKHITDDIWEKFCNNLEFQTNPMKGTTLVLDDKELETREYEYDKLHEYERSKKWISKPLVEYFRMAQRDNKSFTRYDSLEKIEKELGENLKKKDQPIVKVVSYLSKREGSSRDPKSEFIGNLQQDCGATATSPFGVYIMHDKRIINTSPIRCHKIIHVSAKHPSKKEKSGLRFNTRRNWSKEIQNIKRGSHVCMQFFEIVSPGTWSHNELAKCGSGLKSSPVSMSIEKDLHNILNYYDQDNTAPCTFQHIQDAVYERKVKAPKPVAPVMPAEPAESAEPTESTDPMEPAESAEPTESTDPAEPVETTPQTPLSKFMKTRKSAKPGWIYIWTLDSDEFKTSDGKVIVKYGYTCREDWNERINEHQYHYPKTTIKPLKVFKIKEATKDYENVIKNKINNMPAHEEIRQGTEFTTVDYIENVVEECSSDDWTEIEI